MQNLSCTFQQIILAFDRGIRVGKLLRVRLVNLDVVRDRLGRLGLEEHELSYYDAG